MAATVGRITAAQVAELRRWLRKQAATGPSAPPGWVAAVWPAQLSTVRRLLRRLLDDLVVTAVIHRSQATAWAEAARLSRHRLRQSAVAARFGVSARTVRAWLTSVDEALAGALWQPPAVQPDMAERWRTDPVELVVALTRLAHAVVEQGGSIEELEAVRGFAADRLGGSRPRRTGARRWVRKRAYDTIPHRLAVLSDDREAPPRLHLAQDEPGVIPVAYELSADPGKATAELDRARVAQDRLLVPILMNHLLSLLADRPDVSGDVRGTALEIAATLLRDAENSQALLIARAWHDHAARTWGPADYRTWKARSVLVHTLEIHGFHRLAATLQRRQVERFWDLRYPDSHDRSLHVHDRLARLVSIELAAGMSGGLDRAADAVQQMRSLLDKRIGDIPESHWALRRCEFELALVRARTSSRGQRLGVHPQLDRLAEEHLTMLLQAPPGQMLWALDLLISLAGHHRDWRLVEVLVARAEAASRCPDAAPNLLDRVNRRLRWLGRYSPLARHAVPVPPDPLRDPRFLPTRWMDV